MISKKWLDAQLPYIQKNLKVDNSKQVVYHISLNPSIKLFTPMISLSAAHSEDRTVPRINVGSTVADAMYGVSIVTYAALYGGSYLRDEKSKRDPIYTIYSANVDGVVIPSKKLVYDADFTNEKWLVADKPANISVDFEKVGEFFVSEVVRGGGVETSGDKTVILLRVRKGIKLALDKGVQLTAGEYRCVVMSDFKHGDRGTFDYTLISTKEYNEVRKRAIEEFKGL